MTYGMVKWWPILNQQSEEHGCHRKPTVMRIQFYEFHIPWSDEIKCQYGWNIPEVERKVMPKAIVESKLTDKFRKTYVAVKIPGDVE